MMFCRKCGTENDDNNFRCTACGEAVQDAAWQAPQPGWQPAPPVDAADDPVLRMILPIGRSGWAIAAGYAGLLSVLGVFGPFAILLAILAIQDIKRNPKKLGMGRAIFGLVMGILGTVGLVALVVMSLIAPRR